MTAKLVLLGTAAGPTPKVGRNAPAQAVVVDEATYLIDCGNAVAPQLVRAGIPISSLEAVFLTHNHSDHIADFGTLFLVGWSQLSKRVRVFGPPPLSRMIDQFFELHDFDISLRTADEGRQPLRELVEAHEISGGGLIFEDERVRVTATLVNHPPIETAFAYRLDSKDRSIVISGDTTACQQVIDLADGADVLVHEAMYIQGLDVHMGDYAAKNLRQHLLSSHTRVEDAGAVAQAARVKTLVLSHLFPSDSSVPDDLWLSSARSQFDGNVVVGRDLLVV
jgi:ribonuclease BN (tRNA processing enzyme)